MGRIGLQLQPPEKESLSVSSRLAAVRTAAAAQAREKVAGETVVFGTQSGAQRVIDVLKTQYGKSATVIPKTWAQLSESEKTSLGGATSKTTKTYYAVSALGITPKTMRDISGTFQAEKSWYQKPEGLFGIASTALLAGIGGVAAAGIAKGGVMQAAMTPGTTGGGTATIGYIPVPAAPASGLPVASVFTGAGEIKPLVTAAAAGAVSTPATGGVLSSVSQTFGNILKSTGKAAEATVSTVGAVGAQLLGTKLAQQLFGSPERAVDTAGAQGTLKLETGYNGLPFTQYTRPSAAGETTVIPVTPSTQLSPMLILGILGIVVLLAFRKGK